MLSEHLKKLAREFHDADIYVVGGAVRDWLLMKPITDIDLAVYGEALLYARAIASFVGGSVVNLNGRHNISRVAIDGKIVFDITGFDGTIEEELARRDFTVNALAVLLRNFHGSDKSVIGCVDDVYNRILEPVSSDIFTDDGVRILRALRIARQCDMVISHELHRLIIRDNYTLSKSAPERIMKEFLHLLSMPQAMMEMRNLDQYGLLAMIFPELEACRGVNQPKKYHMYDVLRAPVKGS